jgi:hypothetical protein
MKKISAIIKILVLGSILVSKPLYSQNISNLVDTIYHEGSAPVLFGTHAEVSEGGFYGGGFLRVSIENKSIGDRLEILSDQNPEEDGALSVSNGNLYLGNGNGKDSIGSIDQQESGLDGQNLKINFGLKMHRTSFEEGFENWTAVNSVVDLGITSILGVTSPDDPTPTPLRNDDGDSDFPTINTGMKVELSTKVASHGQSALYLRSNLIAKEKFDVVHGPYVYSPIFTAEQNDLVSIDWRAYAGSDAFDIFGYLIEVNTKEVTLFIDETGNDDTGYSPWATSIVTIPRNGEYRIVFVSGTYDFSGGRAAGSSIYIDNVILSSNRVDDKIITGVLQRVGYSNTCGTSSEARQISVSLMNTERQQANTGMEIQIQVSAPIARCKDLAVNLDQHSEASINALDLDNGSSDNCSLTFSASQTLFSCNELGNNTVTLFVRDSYGNESSCHSNVLVKDESPPVVLTRNLTLEPDETGNVQITPEMIDQGSFDNCNLTRLWTEPSLLTCTNVGENTVTLFASDASGNTGSATALVTLFNNPPVLDPIQINLLFNTDETVYAEANFSDNNIFYAEWNWGNGITKPGLIENNKITGTFSFSEAGIYNLTLTLTDVCGLTASKTVSDLVVINPCGGSVTGGGWIGSEPGDWAGLAKSEKANYGFVAQYNPQGKLQGNVTFHLNKANFKVHSNDLDWLVVVNDMALFSGKASVNNIPGYTFVVSLVDGQITGKKNPDLFRILLWDSNGTIVYDNEPGRQSYERATEAIIQGSVVFHRDKSCEEKNMKSLSWSDSSEPVFNQLGHTVKVYPNPVGNLLFIELPRLENEKVSYCLTDISGKAMVPSTKLEPNQQISWIDLQPFSLEPGVYFLKLSGEKQMQSSVFRLIKK